MFDLRHGLGKSGSRGSRPSGPPDHSTLPHYFSPLPLDPSSGPRSVMAPPRSEWRATLCQGAARASKYRASWRRGPLRQKLCSGLLEPTGPWGQESQLTLAPTGSHPHRPSGRTKIVLPSPRLSPIHHPKPMSFQRRAGGRNDMQPPAVRGVVLPMVWKYVVMDA